MKWSPGLNIGLKDVITKSRRLPLDRRKPRISPGDGQNVTSEQLIRVYKVFAITKFGRYHLHIEIHFLLYLLLLLSKWHDPYTQAISRGKPIPLPFDDVKITCWITMWNYHNSTRSSLCVCLWMSERVVKFNGLFRRVDNEFHVIHISRVIMIYSLILLSSLT